MYIEASSWAHGGRRDLAGGAAAACRGRAVGDVECHFAILREGGAQRRGVHTAGGLADDLAPLLLGRGRLQ